MAELQFTKDVNLLVDPDRTKRKCAAQRILKSLQDPVKDPFAGDNFKGTSDEKRKGMESLTKSCLRLFEDVGETCREAAVGIVGELLTRQDASILAWVLPSIVARIGLEKMVESSEEIRLQLLTLAIDALRRFPNDIGQHIDFYGLLLDNCVKDSYPQLKRMACDACIMLCKAEPKKVKHVTPTLAATVKIMALNHKHGVVRAAAVNAFASLLSHGAVEMLGDTKDEQDNRTTVHALFVLANDHTESVRLAIVDLLYVCMLEITERLDQHRRLMPHLLLLVTDECEQVRLAANTLLLNLGKQHMADNEDNRIDIEKRRITLKDLDWHADDQYPDMTLKAPSSIAFPGGLKHRPTLGARYVVAEVVRTYLEKVLVDVNALDWTIPHSNVNKRIAALRILAMSIYYSETNIVQSTQIILSALYKGLKDDNPDVRAESLACVEILGKFLKPEHYLPFIIAQPPKEQEDQRRLVEEENMQLIKDKNRTVQVTGVCSGGDKGGAAVVLPTLLSTAADSIKSCILLSFEYLLLGSRERITEEEATRVTRALVHKDLMVLDAGKQLFALSNCIATFVGDILVPRGLVASPEKPLPVEIKNDVARRTLDSILFYTVLCMLGTDDAAVKAHIESSVIPRMSTAVTGTPYGLYDSHCGRIIRRHESEMPVAVLASLLLHTTDIQPFTEAVSNIFLAHLVDVDFKMKVSDELLFFQTLDRLLWEGKVTFKPVEMEKLLRHIILPFAAFAPGGAATLFRKIGIRSLHASLTDAHLPTLDAVLRMDHSNNNRCPYSGEVKKDTPSPLAERIVTTWLSSMGCDDDTDMRHSCVQMFPAIATLHVSVGSANEAVQHLLMRFDDTNDIIRLETARMMGMVVEKIADGRYYRLSCAAAMPSSNKADETDNASVHDGERSAANDVHAIGGGLPASGVALRPIDGNLRNEICNQKFRDIVTVFLLHMDDAVEGVGLKATIAEVLKVMKMIDETKAAIVTELVAGARKVHHTTQFCDDVLAAPSSVSKPSA